MTEKIPSQIEKFSQEIRRMYGEDQDMRERALDDQGVIENKEDEKLDVKNTDRMKEIIRDIGWPTVIKFGVEISNMAWLLVQHADHDIEFQKYCLELMKTASEGEISKRNIAYLEDRVRVNEGRLQLYGTQFGGEGDNFGPRPIEDPDNVDIRRSELGMETLEEYTKVLKEKYNK